MNYIKEMNAFYDCVEREPLSASAVSLWNTLLHINNKTAWAEEFSVAGVVLKLKGGLTDSSFKRARKELEERGFIEHRSRGTRLAPVYRMKRLYLELSYVNDVEMKKGDRLTDVQEDPQIDNCDNLANQNGSSNDDQKQKKEGNMNQNSNQITDRSVSLLPNLQVTHSLNRMTAPLNKVNQTKQNETKQNSTIHVNAIAKNVTNKTDKKDKADAIVFYQENFGIVSPYLAEEVLAWVNDLGDELVIEGMRRALERGKVSFGYVKGILKSWVRQGISSIDMLRVKEMNKEQSTVHKQLCSGGGSRNEAIVPDWFWERKQKKKEQQEIIAKDEVEDVGELLRKYLDQSAV